MKLVTPYNNKESKKEQVETMFDFIAPKYDFLNHFLSFGVDKYWRKQLIKKVKKHSPKSILDIATGTGDLAIEASKLKPDKIVGIDISEKMLHVGREKIRQKKIENLVTLRKADAEKLPFQDNEFDAVIVAFGIRNFENLENGLKEILRVLKPGGLFIALEFSKPKHFPIKQLYGWYSNRILPYAGKKISGDKSAYTYLPESVSAFAEGEELVSIMNKTGYWQTGFRTLTFRIASLYFGYKP